jgi:beta-lactamase regulating signal transducer with metallopeptidase domain
MNSVLDWLRQAFLIIFEYSVYAAVIALVVMGVRALFGKKLPALFSCALWGIVILRLLLPMPLPLPSVFDFSQMPSQNSLASAANLEAPENAENNLTYGQVSGQKGSEQPVQNESLGTQQNTAKIKQAGQGSFDVMALIAAVWATGFLALVSRTVAATIVSHKRLKTAISLNRPGLAKECAALARVKYGGNVSMSDQFHVPVLLGILRPRIILPLSADLMSDDELKHVILHEMTHQKHGDMWIKTLWSLLLFVNWFNPVLWLSDRLLSRDMECVCDERVIRILGLGSKYAYALSLLKAALDIGQKTTENEALAFAKGNVKRRIEGVMELKKRNKTVTILSLVIVLALSAVLLAACQPTPTLEPVVGRQEDVLESIAQQTAEAAAADETETQVSDIPVVFKKIETPAHVTGTHNDFEKLNLSYDADVTVPDVSAYPVTEMTQRVFSKDDILSFIKLLAGRNDELYAQWNLNKDEWLVKLTKLKQHEDSGIVYLPWLENVQNQYDTAPETVENAPVLIDDLMIPDKIATCYVKNAKGTISGFSLYNKGETFGYNRCTDMAICPASDYEVFDAKWDTKEHFDFCKPGEPDISQEEASGEAQKMLDAMNIDLELFAAQPCSVIVDSTDKTTGWQFVFTRTVSGLQMYDDTGGCFVNPKAMPSYGAPWSQEICTMAVDKDGICFMYWRGASTFSRTAVASAELESFDIIQQRITNQFGYVYGSNDNGSDKKMNIDIFNIKLGISMISVKDQPNTGIYIPTWYVSYYINSDEEMLEQLMFSALDGSYIEPRVSDLERMGRTAEPSGS